MTKYGSAAIRVLDLRSCCEHAYNNVDDQSEFIGNVYVFGPWVDLTTTPLLSPSIKIVSCGSSIFIASSGARPSHSLRKTRPAPACDTTRILSGYIFEQISPMNEPIRASESW